MKRLVPFLFVAALLCGCGKDPSIDPSVGITIDPTSLSLHVGETATISATVTPADLSNKTVLWTTDNTSVAKVSGGVVKAVGAGSATITAKTDRGGQTATCKVTVLPPVLVKSIDLGKSSLSLDPKAGSYTFTPTVLPDDATDKTLEWSSSDEGVAQVKDGVVTLKGKGKAVVTATAKDAGHATASCSITVVSIPDAVDLGLSVKWASFNLGAEKPEGRGEFYAWGETSVKTDYSWGTYAFGQDPFTKYNASGGVLEATDDIASVTLGEGWRMPTLTECTELMDEENCGWEWTTAGDVTGYRITGRKEGFTDKSIFLPAAGYWDGATLVGVGEVGNYWASTLSQRSKNADGLGFSASIICDNHVSRNLGFSIRPVTK